MTKLADVSYRVALLTFPKAFRQQLGERLLEAHHFYRRAGRTRIHRFGRYLQGLWDIVMHGLAERWRRMLDREPTLRERRVLKPWRISMLGQDFRLALRSLRRAPMFAISAIVILALGIGASTSVFSVVNALIFQGVPFSEAHQLVRIFGTYQPTSGPMERRAVSYLDFVDWRDNTSAFQDLVIQDFDNVTLTAEGADPTILTASFLTPNGFTTLGSTSAVGRLLTESDNQVGNLVVVLSHALWTSRFGERPNVVGEAIVLNDRRATVVGVAVEGFGGLFGGVDVWLPFKAEGALIANRPPSVLERRGHRGFIAFGRLRSNYTVEQAQREVNVVSASLVERGLLPPTRGGLVVDFTEDNLGDARQSAFLLVAAVGLVLLIACANLANLLLARQLGRGREMALRLAIGATRRDLVRQLLVESLVIGMLGGVCGVVVALNLAGLVASDTVANLPNYIDPRMDDMTLVFALVVSLLTSVAFGLFPALRASQFSVSTALRSASRDSVGADGGGVTARRLLVVGQITVAVPLLVGAVLMIRSISNTMAIDTGFESNGIAVASLVLPTSRYDGPQSGVFVQQLEDALESRAGVYEAAIASDLPLTFGYSARSVSVDAAGHSDNTHRVYVHRVSPGYFAAFGIEVLEGRSFAQSDDVDAPPTVIIGERMARRFWPNESPIGRTIDDRQIVGVVADAAYRGLIPDAVNNPLDPDLFVPLAQAPTMSLQVVARGTIPISGLTNAIREEVQRLDGSLPIFGLTSMKELVDGQVASARAVTQQLGSFAAIALILAAAGLFGVMAYTVSRRTNEIGVRLALGARRTTVLGMFLRQSVGLVLIGLVSGIGLAVASGRLLQNQLYDVSPVDIGTYLVVAGIFMFVGTLACIVPALRAARVDPLASLRAD